MPNTLTVALAVANPTSASTVRVGATIKAIYVEYWILAASQQPASIVFFIQKSQNDADNMTAT